MLTLVKFADLASLLGLSKPSVDDYPALKLLVSSVYAAIESYTGRYLELGEWTESLPIGGSMIPLRGLPVVSIASITASSGVDLLSDAIISVHGIKLGASVHCEVEVSYVGGYEEAPGALARAALMQIAHEWSRKENIGATSISTDGGSTSWPELGLLKEVKRVLDPFILPARFI